MFLYCFLFESLSIIWKMFLSSRYFFSSPRYLNFCICLSLVGHCWNKWWRICFQNTKSHVMSWFNFNQEIHFTWYFGKKKHSGIETWQHRRMLQKNVPAKKYAENLQNELLSGPFLLFSCKRCKRWKQIFYDLILLNPDNTHK